MKGENNESHSSFSDPMRDSAAQGNLILDFVDAKSKQMIWRGQRCC